MGRKRARVMEERGQELESAVTEYARSHPQMGQTKVAQALTRLGYTVSASGVRYIWCKLGLETTYKRLKALQKSGHASVLTEQQRELMRRGDVSRKLARKSAVLSRDKETPGTVDRRDLILSVAAQLFVERGYSGTSVRDIADRVGMLPGSVYHYFPAKEDLYLAVHRQGFLQLIDRVSAVIRTSGDPWKRLELACAEHIHSAVEGDPIARVTATGLFAIHEESLQRRLKRDREHYDDIFRGLVAALDLRRGTDRSLFRLTLIGALNWTLVWYRPGRKSPPEIARHMVAMLRGQADNKTTEKQR